MVSTILSAGAEVNYKDSDGNTALFFASRGAYLPCMALLIVSDNNELFFCCILKNVYIYIFLISSGKRCWLFYCKQGILL